MNRTSVSVLSIGRADWEAGSLTSPVTCSLTKLTHIMKNIRSCSTTSRSGVRLGSIAAPCPADAPWLMLSSQNRERDHPAGRYFLTPSGDGARLGLAAAAAGAAAFFELWYIWVKRSSAMLAVS